MSDLNSLRFSDEDFYNSCPPGHPGVCPACNRVHNRVSGAETGVAGGATVVTIRSAMGASERVVVPHDIADHIRSFGASVQASVGRAVSETYVCDGKYFDPRRRVSYRLEAGRVTKLIAA